MAVGCELRQAPCSSTPSRLRVTELAPMACAQDARGRDGASPTAVCCSGFHIAMAPACRPAIKFSYPARCTASGLMLLAHAPTARCSISASTQSSCSNGLCPALGPAMAPLRPPVAPGIALRGACPPHERLRAQLAAIARSHLNYLRDLNGSVTPQVPCMMIASRQLKEIHYHQ